MKGSLFVICAPSGAGKTTLITTFIEKNSQKYPLSRVITYTSRAPRSIDIPGVDYHFISSQEFQQKISEQFFLEWSQAYGNYYGSPSSILSHLAIGNSYIMILDQEGAKKVKELYPETILIWLEVDMATLKQRLLHRNSENSEQIKKRLLLAQQEIEYQKKSGFFDYSIKNYDIENALCELQKIAELYLKK